VPQGLHRCALAKEIPYCPLALNFKQFDGDCGLPPLSLINNAVTTLRNLLVEDELAKVNLKILVEGTRLHTDLVKYVLYNSLERTFVGSDERLLLGDGLL